MTDPKLVPHTSLLETRLQVGDLGSVAVRDGWAPRLHRPGQGPVFDRVRLLEDRYLADVLAGRASRRGLGDLRAQQGGDAVRVRLRCACMSSSVLTNRCAFVIRGAMVSYNWMEA
jgi:hypothetical protein